MALAESPDLLRDMWYFALPSGALGRGGMLARTLLGDPVLLARGTDGRVFALRDICPHRAIPLSFGKFDGSEVECCYHGWRFNGCGDCTHIPALTGNEALKAEKVHVRSYPVHEAQGCIWIYMPATRAGIADAPPPPRLPGEPDGSRPVVTVTMRFGCAIDQAAVGLVDPAHGPFVHKNWWWRSPRSMHDKSKRFGPSTLGFTMLRHAPSSNSLAYKVLGGKPETEIAFRLPGIRTELIEVGRHRVVNFTAVTPIDAQTTQITNMLYASMGWARALKPVLHQFARSFLSQDRRVVEMQQVGLRHESDMMLARDADTQARWYFQLKNEWGRSRAEGRAFNNPLREATLHWRS